MPRGAPLPASRAAHPRRCGEHIRPITRLATSRGLIPAGAGNITSIMSGIAWMLGSSPQVRGTSLRVETAECASGLIPAGAGNMLFQPTGRETAWAHPRRCGEHGGPASGMGSGPGLIPAGAGNIEEAAGDSGCSSGSSPQVRGTLAPHGAPAAGVGLIPAGAGNIEGDSDDLDPREGSSPQVRGTSIPGPQTALCRGLIPAGAGNMPWRAARVRSTGAHPRRCGEHVRRQDCRGGCRGSSPQVRGTSRGRTRC